MEHLEGFSSRLAGQGDLPEIGSTVTVEGWRRRGWVHRLALDLRTGHPQASFDVTPFGPVDSPETVAAMNTELGRLQRPAHVC